MRKFFCIILLPFVLMACNEGIEKPDLSNVSTDVSMIRFDSILSVQRSDELENTIPEWLNNHPIFMQVFSQEMIQLGNPIDSKFPYYFRSFLTDTVIREVLLETNKQFTDISALRKQISEGLKMYAYYLRPNIKLDIYFTISGFNQSVLASDSLLIFSMEKYLGRNHRFYSLLHIDNYKRMRMHQDRMVPDMLTALLYNDFEFDTNYGNTLLHSFIYEGKIQYALKNLLPEVQDTILWNYSAEHWKWAVTNETSIWTYLVENDKIYLTESEQIRKFVSDAPFTAPLGQNSAPRALVFIGYRIVESYMKNHPEITLLQLLNMQDAQQLLEQSRYNP